MSIEFCQMLFLHLLIQSWNFSYSVIDVISYINWFSVLNVWNKSHLVVVYTF
jgi:hypothetical protein